MYPRTNYEMTEEDLKVLLAACKPVPVMMIGGHSMGSTQENANLAWAALGKKMGFVSDTVRPIEGKGHRFFSAVPSETEEQRTARVAREKEDMRQKEIASLKSEIGALQERLFALMAPPSTERGEANSIPAAPSSMADGERTER